MQHRRSLAPDRAALGRQPPVAQTVDKPGCVGPGHGFRCPGADLSAVCKGAQVRADCHVIVFVSCITEQDRCHLLPSDGISGTELVPGIASDDALFRCPADGLGIPLSCGHIPEGQRTAGGGLSLRRYYTYGSIQLSERRRTQYVNSPLVSRLRSES